MNQETTINVQVTPISVAKRWDSLEKWIAAIMIFFLLRDPVEAKI